MNELGIGRIVCLTPLSEIRDRSKQYYELITAGSLPWKFDQFPIPDFGVPRDWDSFLNLVYDTASNVRSGERILIHCYAGIGRTGTFAMVLLMALGMSRVDGAAAVRMAHAHPEGMDQQDLIDWCAEKIQKRTG